MGLFRSIKSLFSSSRTQSDDPRHVLGREGERLAGKFLRRSGYKILHRNFRAKHGGEVDLICRDGDVLAFVEVKTRTTDEHARPAEAVNFEKEALICRGARAWLRMLDRQDIVFRFDIVEVVMNGGEPRCSVMKSAFVLPEERRR
jgi:putative endonuclease